MLEGKALVMAIMLLTASPLVIANEDTQILGDGTTIGDLREGLVTNFDRSDDALNKEASTSVDKKERDGLSDEDCLTIEEWREKSEKDWDREDVDRKESSEDREGNEKRVEGEAPDRDVSQEDEDCLTAEQWKARYSYDEDREEPCFTLREFERKLFDDRKDWGRDDKDWNRENWSDEDKKNWSRDDKHWDRENWSDEEREERGDDEACLTMEEWKERFGRDKEGRDKENGKAHDDEVWEEIRARMAELGEACEEGDEVACEELEALIRGCDRERDDRDDKDRDEEDNEEREDSDEETEE
ncbi:MAG: hypothetical protein VX774_02575 [Candidatus Thermoplasmatota archaeon]|nr:hypothetical protein [Candidatus Thermoplasmatota archaeon]